MARQSPPSYRAVLILTPALVLLGILIGATQTHWRAWFSPDPPPAATRLAVSPNCDPVSAFCTARSTQLTIGLGLQGDVRPLRVFTVTAKLEGDAAEEVDAVAVRFTMPDMDMGINRFALGRDSGGFWRGQAMVPICTTARRDWVASVEVTGERRYVADFTLSMGP